MNDRAQVNTNVRKLKLVLLGDQGVGKSSIALRFARSEFHPDGPSTVGAAFFTKTLPIEDRTIQFDIWDTAGQERFHALAPMYYRGAQAAIVVYDITDAETFSKAKEWVRELQRQASAQTLIIFTGNKSDMATDNRRVQIEEGEVFADQNGLIFTETSAKSGVFVNEIFMLIASHFFNEDDTPGTGGNVRLEEAQFSEPKSICSC